MMCNRVDLVVVVMYMQYVSCDTRSLRKVMWQHKEEMATSEVAGGGVGNLKKFECTSDR